MPNRHEHENRPDDQSSAPIAPERHIQISHKPLIVAGVPITPKPLCIVVHRNEERKRTCMRLARPMHSPQCHSCLQSIDACFLEGLRYPVMHPACGASDGLVADCHFDKQQNVRICHLKNLQIVANLSHMKQRTQKAVIAAGRKRLNRLRTFLLHSLQCCTASPISTAP